MKLFQHANRQRSAKSRRIYAIYELAHTAADFGAALCFTIGSALFFWQATETAALWLFLIGSILFMAKPTLRLAREVHLYRIGDFDDLARRTEI